MPHSYASEYPRDTNCEDGIKTLFESFNEISDTPLVHEKYADLFTDDATIIVAGKEIVGRKEILRMREDMWATTASRLKTQLKVYPFGPWADEFMTCGVEDYTFKDGRKTRVDWAARVKVGKKGETWKISFYQVYLDTATFQNAK